MTMAPLAEISLRLALALGAGAAIGLERTFHGRPAGFRTHALVSLGAALLMTCAVFMLAGAGPLGDPAAPSRIAQGVMTGIGFLGAGVIFKERLSVQGLTTAASVWITAALGLLFGAGFWAPGVISLGAILLTLTVLRFVEDHMPRQVFVLCSLKFARDDAMSPEEVRTLFEGFGFKALRFNFKLDEATGLHEYRFYARTRTPLTIDSLADRLQALPRLKGFEVCPSEE